MAAAPDYDQIIREATERLRGKFPDHSEAQVRSVVEEELTRLRAGTVQDYLSVLTVRAAQKRIKAAKASD
ncbi:three-helix bundle dimerization domain-containing protein [Curtobacterium sp. VKM Ac-1376]|uniref:three-helix bundle dimerization domain-containing protein n=1 Tax=Curtobacterium sp. VKM Ac-1376 TaxID=123312 RepID=UPI00188A7D66|nr:hypothetical protein [Curtobacterium sp. VKM Ac-1376]MBF4616214.1 hypothetical protein [Curtobacterium sp. VKM Ac-1376]